MSPTNHGGEVGRDNKNSRESEIVLPFLKWAGGKRWLAHSYNNMLPSNFSRYVEPFLGGGAVFFHLAPKKALLSDINKDLIDCYSAIKKDWQAVERILRRHQRHHSLEYYYKERARVRKTLFERASQFLYLNRTCWNGLYRVNLEGKFNVPIGTKSTVLMPTDDFEETARLLKAATLRTQDFEDTVDSAGSGDFIFADPPYTVKHSGTRVKQFPPKWFFIIPSALALG